MKILYLVLLNLVLIIDIYGQSTPFQNQTFTNSAKQRLDSLIRFKKHDSVWVKTYKYDYHYDVNGNVSDFITHKYSNNKQYRKEYKYDQKGNNILLTILNYNSESDKYEKYSQFEYSYNSNDKIVLILFSKWDNEIGEWIYKYKNEYSYDDKGLAKSFMKSDWDNVITRWENNTKIDYFYMEDSNEKIEQQIEKYWSVDLNKWIDLYKYEDKFDIANNLSKGLSSSWDKEKQEWESQFKYFTYFNEKGEVIKYESFIWENEKWNNLIRRNYEYDVKGNLILKLSSSGHNDSWEPPQKTIYKYNLDFNEDNLIKPFFIKGSNKLLETLIYHTENDSWELYETLTYYYSTQEVNAVDKTNILNTIVFPNPAKDVINFYIENYEFKSYIRIYDLQGEMVIKKLLPISRQIKIDQLSNGIYFYNISNEGRFQNGKFIKK